LSRLPEVGNNAEMRKSFHYSMRRIFGEVSVLCVVAWVVAMVLRIEPEAGRFAAASVAGGATLGGAIGLNFSRPITGAAAGAVLAAIGVCAAIAFLYLTLSGFGGG
jgi:hypothetical protein